MNKLVIPMTILALLNSCSGPMNNEYSKETLKEDLKKIKEKSDLDSITIGMLIDYIETQDSLNGTYEEILMLAQQQKKDEQHMCDIVDQFLTQLIEGSDKIDKRIITTTFDSLLGKYDYYSTKEWQLKSEQENDSVFLVEATLRGHNGFGMAREHIEWFALVNQKGEWRISNSYRLISFGLDFSIVDYDWESLWDQKKYELLANLKNELKLEIIKPGQGNPYTDPKSGELRLINDSEYDIKNVSILIDHFDGHGRSVNTDRKFINDIIRKNGYREFKWTSFDCGNCVDQKFTIKWFK